MSRQPKTRDVKRKRPSSAHPSQRQFSSHASEKVDSNPESDSPSKSSRRSGSAHPSRIPRTSVLHWRNKVERTTSQSGATNLTYSVRIQWKKRRVRFSFETANRNAAASEAARIFAYLIEHGWERTIKKFKEREPDSHLDATEAPTCLTVGEFIQVATRLSTARPRSKAAYAKALRRVVAGAMEISDGKKYQARGECGHEAWRAQIDSVPLAELTPARVQAWKNAYLEAAASENNGDRNARTTINSIVRNAKALFSRRILPFLKQELDLPHPLPFEGITMERQPSLRYRSRIDAKKLLKAAKTTLRAECPEAYKIFLLSLVCGLRVSEIDWLLWDSFDFPNHKLRIENTKYHRLKSEDSAGELDLSAKTTKIFSDFSKSATTEFVIEPGPRKEGNALPASTGTPGSRCYRCDFYLTVLKRWLRDNGVSDPKPIHVLRKECGSELAAQMDIFAASRYLRHSDIRITAAFYADKKRKVVPKFAG